MAPLMAGSVSATFTYGGKHEIVARGSAKITDETGDQLWSTYVAASSMAISEQGFGARSLHYKGTGAKERKRPLFGVNDTLRK
jgi:hypothetical protein